MLRLSELVRFLVVMSLVWVLTGCGGDDVVNPPATPAPPANVFGVVAGTGEGVDMLLMWTDADSLLTGEYNIYRKIGTGAAVKLNSQPVIASPFGSQTYYPKALWFADSTYDTASATVYKYYIASIGSSSESAPSDTVQCIPNTIDPDNAVADLNPDNMSEVDQLPSFSWDAKTGATSYCLMLANDTAHLDYWMWWVYRTTGTSGVFKTSPGITYLESPGDSLGTDHEYVWTLWAIDAHNCGFAVARGDFATYDPDFLLTFVNGSLDAGRYRLCWNQTDLSGRQLAPGTYVALMTAGDFNATDTFDIMDTPPTPPVTVLDCNEDFSGILPASYVLDLDASEYFIADTVKITFDLPAITNVRIDIAR